MAFSSRTVRLPCSLLSMIRLPMTSSMSSTSSCSCKFDVQGAGEGLEVIEMIHSGWLRGVDLNHRPLGYENRGHHLSAEESVTPKVKISCQIRFCLRKCS